MCFGIPVSENAPGFHYFRETDTRTATEEAMHITAQEITGAEPGDTEPHKDRPDATDMLDISTADILGTLQSG